MKEATCRGQTIKIDVSEWQATHPNLHSSSCSTYRLP